MGTDEAMWTMHMNFVSVDLRWSTMVILIIRKLLIISLRLLGPDSLEIFLMDVVYDQALEEN